MGQREIVRIVPLDGDLRGWAAHMLDDHWGSAQVVSRGVLYDAAALSGLVALRGTECIGLVTYRIEGHACEIVTLDSLVEGIGVGSALIAAVRDTARAAGCARLWLITTNDNLHALGFYQKRGFRLAALHPNALEQSRRLKPQIPLVGMDGIPLRDEIELDMPLDPSDAV